MKRIIVPEDKPFGMSIEPPKPLVKLEEHKKERLENLVVMHKNSVVGIIREWLLKK